MADSAVPAKRSKASSSIYLGVSRITHANRWQARIRVKDTNIQLGTFATEQEAAQCYDAGARKHHGPRAVLNFPSEEDFALGRRWALQRAPDPVVGPRKRAAVANGVAPAAVKPRTQSKRRDSDDEEWRP